MSREPYTKDEELLCTYIALYGREEFTESKIHDRHNVFGRSLASIKMKVKNIAAMLDEENIFRNSDESSLSGRPPGEKGRRTHWEWIQEFIEIPQDELYAECMTILNSDNTQWTKEELKASVEAYIDMRIKEAHGEPFTKISYYAVLSKRFGRSEGAYEYRMQNISYVYSLMGRDWVAGLKPARNVGANVAGELEKIINEIEGQESIPIAEFNSTINTLLHNDKEIPRPNGDKHPAKSSSESTQYRRDPKVVAWVLRHANGVCESCGDDAPFLKEDGMPFLEVHHLHRLADNGPDTVYNAIAICPNCHRELHLGSNRKAKVIEIRSRIGRLRDPDA